MTGTTSSIARRCAAGIGLALAAFACAAAAHSPEPQAYNTVDLQAEVQREVANDTLNAMLYAELNDADAARLADSLNRTAAAALALAKEFPQVRVRSGASRTYPVYDSGQQLKGWRGHTELRMESKDFEAAATLIGRMQATLQLGQFGFSASPETRKAAVDAMIAEAIRAFRARAEVVRAAMGGRGYKIRHLAINTGGGGPVYPFMAAPRSSAPASVVPPPAEGGASQVSVSVSGTIEVE